MDMSIRLDVVLGQHKVGAEELSASEWLTLVQSLLKEARPQLRYMSGFVPVEDSMNWVREYDRRITDPAVVECPGDFAPTMRCLPVAYISRDMEGVTPWGSGNGVRFIAQEDLLLTQREGAFVRWSHRYERQHRMGLGYRAHRDGTDEIAFHSRFTFVDAAGLAALMTPRIGGSILKALHMQASASVKERIRRLETMRSLEARLGGVRQRIATGCDGTRL